MIDTNKTYSVKVLGAKWKINFSTDEAILCDAGGITDNSIKTITIRILDTDDNEVQKNRDAWYKQTIRHEIIHAFLYESGLEANSTLSENWALNEEMIDWFAFQSPKIFKAFEKLGVL